MIDNCADFCPGLYAQARNAEVWYRLGIHSRYRVIHSKDKGSCSGCTASKLVPIRKTFKTEIRVKQVIVRGDYNEENF